MYARYFGRKYGNESWGPIKCSEFFIVCETAGFLLNNVLHIHFISYILVSVMFDTAIIYPRLT
jgi:hypothetical protein